MNAKWLGELQKTENLKMERLDYTFQNIIYIGNVLEKKKKKICIYSKEE